MYCQYFNFAVLDDFRAFLQGFSGEDYVYYSEYAYSEDGFFPETIAYDYPVEVDGSTTDPATAVPASTDGSSSGSDVATQGLKSGAGGSKGAAAKGSAAGTRAAINSLSSQARTGKVPKDAAQQLQDKIIARGSPAAAQFLSTPAGAALLERATRGPSAKLGLGTTSIAADTAARTLAPLAMPLANITQALSNLTNTVVANATNVALKAAVSTLSVTAPVLGLRANLTRAVAQPIADIGDQLATATEAALQQQEAVATAAPGTAAQPTAVAPGGGGTVQMLEDVAGR